LVISTHTWNYCKIQTWTNQEKTWNRCQNSCVKVVFFTRLLTLIWNYFW
jgi:hypothetical protein